jgi:hypothetical protein
MYARADFWGLGLLVKPTTKIIFHISTESEFLCECSNIITNFVIILLQIIQ